MKRLLATFLVASLAVQGAPAFADSNYNYGARSTPVALGYWRGVITERYPDGLLAHSRNPFDTSNIQEIRNILRGGFSTVLAPCSQTLVTGCISEVSYKVGEDWLSATPAGHGTVNKQATGMFVDGKLELFKDSNYPADPKHGIFEGTDSLLWNLNQAPHPLGTSYRVNAIINSSLDKNDYAKIVGIDLEAWAMDANGQRAVDLPKDLQLRVKVNLGQRLSELSGWFDGRLNDPKIDFGLSEPGVLAVEGQPLSVSTVATREIYKDEEIYKQRVGAEAEKLESSKGKGVHGTIFSRQGMADFKALEPYLQEKAVSTNTYWRLSSWVQGSVIRSNCKSSNKVLGIAISNATTYDPGAPAWNANTSTIDFQVASAHLLEDGTLNTGYYKLLVNEGYAKCLWGSNIRSAKASISVFANTGEKQVATTVFAVKNGWAVFEAAGFHYSTPKIRVTLKKAVTVSCISKTNPKVVKKITGAGPVCPTGFKKK